MKTSQGVLLAGAMTAFPAGFLALQSGKVVESCILFAVGLILIGVRELVKK